MMKYTEISFPSLGISVNPSSVAFHVGNLSVYWYGLLIAAGLCLAVVYCCRRSKQFGIKEDDILDGLLWTVPLAVVGARAYYCIFNWSIYADNPISCLYIWEGGLAIYGGILGAILGVYILCRVKRIKLGALLDLVVLGFFIGQAIGRWGNFFNREAFGAETESFLRMGLMHTNGDITYHHPTFLYESVWNAVGFLICHVISKHRKFDGELFFFYLMWYGLGRAWIEGLRTDSLYLFGTGLRVSQVLALCSFVFGTAMLIYHLAVKKHTPDELFCAQVQEKGNLSSQDNDGSVC